MGYRIVSDPCANFDSRQGLEGPWNFSGRVLYYDPREGQYYDPTTDFYVEQEEMDAINQQLVNILAN